MALDIKIFHTITPSRFITFTIPNPTIYPPSSLLRLAVLDSPITLPDSPPRVAAMCVPKHRESDWIFSTEFGHIQLLFSLPAISRLILIGDQPINGSDSTAVYTIKNNPGDREKLEQSLKPLVMALSPKICFENEDFEVPFLSYEDNVVCSVTLDKCFGSFAGEMLVEDVTVESSNTSQYETKLEFRRRLRFKRMPNLIQTEIKLVPESSSRSDFAELGKTKFRPDVRALVHPYLAPMVASLALIDSHRVGFRPKAICIGVGGGALLSFLKCQLGFEVLGVELDHQVLRVAKQYFGLEEDGDCMQIHTGDAIEFLEKLASKINGSNSGTCKQSDNQDTKFDVVMVDLDSSDAINGISAPPLEFLEEPVLVAVRSVLSTSGILVMNVIPPTRLFYDTLIHKFRMVFCELYEIAVGNEENFVLVATVSPVVISSQESENSFISKLRSVIPGIFLDSITKIKA